MCAQDFDSDDEYIPVYSDPKKRISEKTRRKRNKLWSLPEVVKLVDGISQFGVGKWTAIRRKFFSSSSYRTSLDIRIKESEEKILKKVILATCYEICNSICSCMYPCYLQFNSLSLRVGCHADAWCHCSASYARCCSAR
ncbi:hypothetical protein Dimus_037160 [Dionaea muscipula]